MKQETLVSVVMPAYNAEATIEESLRSVLGQTHREIEVLVVDDGSADRTLDVVRNLGDARIKVLRSEKNAGVAAARNRGLSAAQGRYIAFCDADDIWREDKLATQLALIEEKQCPVVSSYLQILSTNKSNGKIRTAPVQIGLSEIKRRNFLFMSTTMIDRARIKSLEFRPIFHEDYDFWLRNASAHEAGGGGPFAHCVELPLCLYRLHNSNITRNKFYSLKKHFLVQRNNGMGWIEIATQCALNVLDRLRRSFATEPK